VATASRTLKQHHSMYDTFDCCSAVVLELTVGSGRSAELRLVLIKHSITPIVNVHDGIRMLL
jgi:hypothetical protein